MMCQILSQNSLSFFFHELIACYQQAGWQSHFLTEGLFINLSYLSLPKEEALFRIYFFTSYLRVYNVTEVTDKAIGQKVYC